MSSKYVCYDSNGDVITSIYQWDTNRVISVSNINVWSGADVYFHFCNNSSEKCYVEEPTLSGSNYIATIPNELLRSPENIILYISQKTQSDENAVVGEIRIPLIQRKRPSDYDSVVEPSDSSESVDAE